MCQQIGKFSQFESSLIRWPHAPPTSFFTQTLSVFSAVGSSISLVFNCFIDTTKYTRMWIIYASLDADNKLVYLLVTYTSTLCRYTKLDIYTKVCVGIQGCEPALNFSNACIPVLRCQRVLWGILCAKQALNALTHVHRTPVVWRILDRLVFLRGRSVKILLYFTHIRFFNRYVISTLTATISKILNFIFQRENTRFELSCNAVKIIME